MLATKPILLGEHALAIHWRHRFDRVLAYLNTL